MIQLIGIAHVFIVKISTNGCNLKSTCGPPKYPFITLVLYVQFVQKLPYFCLTGDTFVEQFAFFFTVMI